jgi:prolyl oligopeptidase
MVNPTPMTSSEMKQLFSRATAASLLLAMVWISADAQTSEPQDKYQWLEDVSSPRSMAWVKAENERSAKVLQSDPRFASLDAMALKVLESPDRLPLPDFREGAIYNVWQDAQHVRGILRRTSLADYLTAQPQWQTVLDYDALAKEDNEKWVQKGLTCLYPGDKLCLVELSAGGEDAETMREFDLKAGKFVEGGFLLPRSKQDVAWVDKDTLLVARDWGAGTMTTSGYPFVVKLWKRGEPLEQAKEVYRGADTDVEVDALSLHDGQGHHATIFDRSLNIFEHEISLWTPAGAHKIALPAKVEINGLLAGRLIVTIDEDWKPRGIDHTFAQGSVLAFDLKALEKDPEQLKPTIVFASTSQEFAQEVAVTKNHLLLTTLEHVQGRAYAYTVGSGGEWTRTRFDVPDNRTVDIVTTNRSDDQFFFRLTGFLTPSSLLLGDAAAGSLKEAKTLPPQFDAANLIVEQLEATSKDGTHVPYFVVRRKDLKYDSNNPTLLEAYGGFQVSETPAYSGIIGKLWLERGGVYVLANIRGGGEFGPAWHEAGLKTHRQRIYDDFAAVGQDLVTRKITSPPKLGIVGGSNGGLLMGVEMTQHPELWHAIVIQVPLLDMLRFEQIAAGASWVGEYGSVSAPDQRAFLASISPYNQLKPDVTYPEPLTSQPPRMIGLVLCTRGSLPPGWKSSMNRSSTMRLSKEATRREPTSRRKPEPGLSNTPTLRGSLWIRAHDSGPSTDGTSRKPGVNC